MDFIFDCFFEEILGTIERSGLKTRQNRQNVIDQLDSVIAGCSAGKDAVDSSCVNDDVQNNQYQSGQDVPHEEVSRLAVESAIKYHKMIKEKNSEVCRMGKYHNVLYIALKVSWNWGIKDSNVICTLLNEIFKCEETFERLFLGAIFGSNAPFFIAGWRSDFRDQDENSRAAVFFLHHASIKRLQFMINGHSIPFIDVPIESCGKSSPLRVALQATAPDILMILLRNGANSCPLDGGTSPAVALLDKLMEYDESGSYPYQLVSCLKILLLAIPFIELPYKPLLFHARKEMFLEKYSSLIRCKIIPYNRAFGVPELKHLCRCAIREALRLNFQLPNGIASLKIPKSLKRYVDLLQE